jgi:DNA adenine methylase
MTISIPPIKCQGIKTKLVPLIKECTQIPAEGTWIEPFCGSCVVALNIKPQRAILSDTNSHIITLYRNIQEGRVTPEAVRAFLEREGETLARYGAEHYYSIRQRFNESHDSLDFLFLNRACFNGVMRFNGRGEFNVPFCKKADRFSPAYITKIVNQIKKFRDVVQNRQWTFVVRDFRETLREARVGDFLYADPPYIGRHVDYFHSWNAQDEADLAAMLRQLPCNFILSTWHSNEYRENPLVQNWSLPLFFTRTFEHFYHVGATEDLRSPMLEALVANYNIAAIHQEHIEQAALF